jgi:hypothetical protein
MSFKGLFFTETEGEANPVAPVTQPTVPVVNAVTFPTTAPSTFPTGAESTPTNNRFLKDIMDVYDKGFEKLNKPGYDFFEFFKSVYKTGVDNPQVYQMAFEMAQGMDNSITKALLLSQSDYYITEIEKVYASFTANGKQKIQDITEEKNAETKKLTGDIDSLKKQLEIIKAQLSEKEKSLAEIDGSYAPSINDISEKLSANDIAKETLITNLTKVKNNIQNHLK